MVHDHGRKRWGRIEQATIHNQDPDVLGLHIRLGEEFIDGAKHNSSGFLPGLGHRGIRRNIEDSLREVSVLAKARPFEDLTLEFEVLFRERARQLGPLHEDLPGALPGLLRLVACKVDEIDRPRTGEEVEGGEEDEERGAEDHGDEIKPEMIPEVVEVLDREGRELGGDEDDEGCEEEVHAMGDEVVVTELDILELHRLREAGETARG